MSKLFRGNGSLIGNLSPDDDEASVKQLSDEMLLSHSNSVQMYMLKIKMLLLTLKESRLEEYNTLVSTQEYAYYDNATDEFQRRYTEAVNGIETLDELNQEIMSLRRDLENAGDALQEAYYLIVGGDRPEIKIAPVLDMKFPLMCNNEEAPHQVKEWLLVNEQGVTNKTVFCQLPSAFYEALEAAFGKEGIRTLAPKSPGKITRIIFQKGLQLSNGYSVEMVYDSFVCVAKRTLFDYIPAFIDNSTLVKTIKSVTSIAFTTMRAIGKLAIQTATAAGNAITNFIFRNLSLNVHNRLEKLGITYTAATKRYYVNPITAAIIGSAPVAIVAFATAYVVSSFIPVSYIMYTTISSLLSGINAVFAAIPTDAAFFSATIMVPVLRVAHFITHIIVNATGSKTAQQIRFILAYVTSTLTSALMFWGVMSTFTNAAAAVTYASTLRDSITTSLKSFFEKYNANSTANSSTSSAPPPPVPPMDHSPWSNSDARVYSSEWVAGRSARELSATVFSAINDPNVTDGNIASNLSTSASLMGTLTKPVGAFIGLMASVIGTSSMHSVENVTFGEDLLQSVGKNPELNRETDNITSNIRISQTTQGTVTGNGSKHEPVPLNPEEPTSSDELQKAMGAGNGEAGDSEHPANGRLFDENEQGEEIGSGDEDTAAPQPSNQTSSRTKAAASTRSASAQATQSSPAVNSSKATGTPGKSASPPVKAASAQAKQTNSSTSASAGNTTTSNSSSAQADQTSKRARKKQKQTSSNPTPTATNASSTNNTTSAESPPSTAVGPPQDSTLQNIAEFVANVARSRPAQIAGGLLTGGAGAVLLAGTTAVGFPLVAGLSLFASSLYLLRSP